MSVLKFWLPVAATAAVLLGVEWQSQPLRAKPEEAVAYMAACRQAAEEIPYTLPGGWIGVDTEVPTVVDEILQPNVLVSRNYRSLSGNQRVSLLIVQTEDVQRLLGHFPPACYPGRGWTNLGGEPLDQTVGDLVIDGTHYQMVPPGVDPERPVHIYNFFLRPDGETGRDMDAVWASGRSGRSRYFGAGQVQVLFFGDMSPEQRDQAFAAVVGECMPAIAQILNGYDSE